MKKVLAILILAILQTAHAGPITSCEGTFENGRPVHVQIDWDKWAVTVNDTSTQISGSNIAGNGITTKHCTNRFGYQYYFVILRTGGQDMLAQTSATTDYDGTRTTMHVATLYCSKSFTKPFMERMLDDN